MKATLFHINPSEMVSGDANSTSVLQKCLNELWDKQGWDKFAQEIIFEILFESLLFLSGVNGMIIIP